MSTLSFRGETNATIRIGTRTVPLSGKFDDDLSGKKRIRVEYRAAGLDDAIDLGSSSDALLELKSLLQSDSTDAVMSELTGALAKIPAGIPADTLLGGLRAKLTEFTTPGNASIHAYLTEIQFQGVYAVSPAAFTGSIGVGLSFQLTGARIFNIELLSAGIRLTATVT